MINYVFLSRVLEVLVEIVQNIPTPMQNHAHLKVDQPWLGDTVSSHIHLMRSPMQHQVTNNKQIQTNTKGLLTVSPCNYLRAAVAEDIQSNYRRGACRLRSVQLLPVQLRHGSYAKSESSESGPYMTPSCHHHATILSSLSSERIFSAVP